jgi:hypothetical protein
MATRWINRDLTPKTEDILSNAESYHSEFNSNKTFTGPSLYFHQQALMVNSENWARKNEMIYAALASWGMHRMGPNGSKMKSFNDFNNSIGDLRTDIEFLHLKSPNDLSSDDWTAIERVFKKIELMASNTKIVGNSKVMAHYLPNLIPPIDREYTFQFLFGKKQVKNDLEYEWRLMQKILLEFFYPIACNKSFQKVSKEWLNDTDSYPWDTSPLKVIDNLIIGAVRKR